MHRPGPTCPPPRTRPPPAESNDCQSRHLTGQATNRQQRVFPPTDHRRWEDPVVPAPRREPLDQATLLAASCAPAIAELPRSLFGRASPDSSAAIQSVVVATAAKFELCTVISVECTATRMMAKRFDGSIHPRCASPAWICRTPDSSLHLRPLRLAGSASVRISGARLGRPQISPHLLIGRRRAEAADHRHRSWILWQGPATRRAFASTV